MRRWPTLILLSLWSSCVLAQADIAIDVDLPGGTFVPPGTFVDVIITITNNGPATATGVTAGTVYTLLLDVGFPETVEVLPIAATPPCSVSFFDLTRPDEFSVVSLRIFPSGTVPTTLLPGEAISCVLGLATSPIAPNQVTQFFVAGSDADDPVSENDITSVLITTGNALDPLPVTAVSFGSLLLMLIGVITIAISKRPITH